MLATVREAAQLGKENYTTNANESVNGRIKNWTGREKNKWSEFPDIMMEYITAKEQEAERAIYGAGEYEIDEVYASALKVDTNVWHSLNQAERLKHLLRFRRYRFKGVQSNQHRLPGMKQQ